MMPYSKLACLSALASTVFCASVFGADQAAQTELDKKLFSTATPACALCHTLKDAGAEGAVGPVMDEIKPDAARVAKALRNGLGRMPSYSNSH